MRVMVMVKPYQSATAADQMPSSQVRMRSRVCQLMLMRPRPP